ncbi:MAG TPA: anti-sigma factor, partial [Solirubrobacteraceae bacterium]|nr:anti-sigma factor [Solirubrobacteraceae bacterium]
APPDRARAGAPRASRRGAAILLGGALLAAVAVVLVFALRDSGGDGDDAAAPPARTTTQAQRPKVVAQANLVPPRSRRGSRALGVVLIQRAGSRQQIVAAVQGLTRPRSGGYGIWLYAGSRRKWLGFFASQDDQGRLLARGELEETVGDYREILVTREAKGNPSDPGPIFLRGPIQVASGDGG